MAEQSGELRTAGGVTARTHAGISFEARVEVPSDEGNGVVAVRTQVFETLPEAREWVLSHATITKVVRKAVR